MHETTTRVAEVRVSGPLAPLAAGFRSKLNDAGYTAGTSARHMQLMAHLSRWLDASGLSAADLSGQLLEEYVVTRRAPRATGGCTHSARWSPCSTSWRARGWR